MASGRSECLPRQRANAPAGSRRRDRDQRQADEDMLDHARSSLRTLMGDDTHVDTRWRGSHQLAGAEDPQPRQATWRHRTRRP